MYVGTYVCIHGRFAFIKNWKKCTYLKGLTLPGDLRQRGTLGGPLKKKKKKERNVHNTVIKEIRQFGDMVYIWQLERNQTLNKIAKSLVMSILLGCFLVQRFSSKSEMSKDIFNVDMQIVDLKM
jgi:hypothetical protein